MSNITLLMSTHVPPQGGGGSGPRPASHSGSESDLNVNVESLLSDIRAGFTDRHAAEMALTKVGREHSIYLYYENFCISYKHMLSS